LYLFSILPTNSPLMPTRFTFFPIFSWFIVRLFQICSPSFPTTLSQPSHIIHSFPPTNPIHFATPNIKTHSFPAAIINQSNSTVSLLLSDPHIPSRSVAYPYNAYPSSHQPNFFSNSDHQSPLTSRHFSSSPP
jgi:hypothetical protein